MGQDVGAWMRRRKVYYLLVSRHASKEGGYAGTSVFCCLLRIGQHFASAIGCCVVQVGWYLMYVGCALVTMILPLGGPTTGGDSYRVKEGEGRSLLRILSS